MSDSPAQLFERWVLAVVPKLRELPNGDGAFAALSMAFGLYERFIDSLLHQQQIKASPANFSTQAAKDFGLAGGAGVEAIERMWSGFRLGMQHAFQPKAYTEDAGRGDRWGWDISEEVGYHAYPVVVQLEKDLFIVTLNPWLFLAHTLQRWREHPDLMNELSEFRLGAIARTDKTLPPVPADLPHTHYQSNQTGSATPFQQTATGICPPRT